MSSFVTPVPTLLGFLINEHLWSTLSSWENSSIYTEGFVTCLQMQTLQM